MGKCKWVAPKGSLIGYSDCPHGAEEGQDFCLFHLPLEEKRENPDLVKRFKKRFYELYEAGERDFRAFIFPDGMNISGWDFRRDYEKENREPETGEQTGPTTFSLATFGTQTRFNRTIFGDRTFFMAVTFDDGVSFNYTKFGNWAKFDYATFGDQASFNHTTFSEQVMFYIVTFRGKVYFNFLTGRTRAFLARGRWKGQSTLDADLDRPSPAGLVFERTKFQGPADFSNTDLSKTKFQQVNLKNLSFLHSDISETKFIACDWGQGYENKKFVDREPGTGNLFNFRRPRLLQDELDWRTAKRKGETTPTSGDIEVLALQLKQSLEATRDPIAAGDFHFAAMEMKRERAVEQGHKARAKILWVYKMLNGYGERYGRAFMWVVLTLLIFTGINYWFNGLYPAEKILDVQAGGIKKAIQDFLADVDWWPRLRHGAAYALQNLLPFKINSGFLKVSGEWIQLLAVVETVIGTTLFTFFALALRRRFKR